MQRREVDARAEWAERFLFESPVAELVRRKGLRS